MRLLAYRADFLTAGEMSSQDPFGGRGLRLDIPPQTLRPDAVRMIESMHPGCPYVIWDDCAWIDQPGSAGQEREK